MTDSPETRREYPDHDVESLTTLADELAERAYRRYAVRFDTVPDSVPREKTCTIVNPDLGGLLQERGVSLQAARWDGMWAGSPGVTHTYLESGKEPDDVVVDGAWKQFLDPDFPTKHLPNVLVARRRDLPEVLLSLGVRPGMLTAWDAPVPEGVGIDPGPDSDEWPVMGNWDDADTGTELEVPAPEGSTPSLTASGLPRRTPQTFGVDTWKRELRDLRAALAEAMTAEVRDAERLAQLRSAIVDATRKLADLSWGVAALSVEPHDTGVADEDYDGMEEAMSWVRRAAAAERTKNDVRTTNTQDLPTGQDDGSIEALKKGSDRMAVQGEYHATVGRIVGEDGSDEGLEGHKGKLNGVAEQYEQEGDLAKQVAISVSGLVKALKAASEHHTETVMPAHKAAGEMLGGDDGASGIIGEFRREFPERDDRDYLREADAGFTQVRETTDGETESLRAVGSGITTLYDQAAELVLRVTELLGTEEEPGGLQAALAGIPEQYRGVAQRDEQIRETLVTQRAIS